MKMANMEQALVTLLIIVAWMFPFLVGALAMVGLSEDGDLLEYLIEEYEETKKEKLKVKEK